MAFAGILGLGGCSSFDREQYITTFFDQSKQPKSHIVYLNPLPYSNYQNYSNLSFYSFGGFGGNVLKELSYRLSESFRAEYQLISYGAWRHAMDDIRDDVLNNKELIFLAHSLGCKDAIHVAHLMQEVNPPVQIKALILFDATHLRNPIIGAGGECTIPGNISFVLNYSSKGFFHGRLLKNSDTMSTLTKILNTELSTGHNELGNEEHFLRYCEDLARALGWRILQREEKD
jgi:hypothetical protein